MQALERENIRLKRLVAEKELDIQILKGTLAVDTKTSEPGEVTGHLYTALEISHRSGLYRVGSTALLQQEG